MRHLLNRGQALGESRLLLSKQVTVADRFIATGGISAQLTSPCLVLVWHGLALCCVCCHRHCEFM